MTILTWASAMTAGAETLASMFIRGELSISQAWCAVKGAATYTARLANGEAEASPAAERERVEKCANCPIRGERNIGNGVTAVYCGTPFEGGGVACGCLVALTRDGGHFAAAKTKLAAESCPAGFWGADDV